MNQPTNTAFHPSIDGLRQNTKLAAEAADRALALLDGPSPKQRLLEQMDRFLGKASSAEQQPVDVLAYLRLMAEAQPEYAPELEQIIGAVGELIDAADYIAFAMRDGAVFDRDYAAQRLAAARARCGARS